jgi:hypothetical protein
VKGFSKEEESTVRDDQSVAEMANEVLVRQAKVRSDRTGEPIEEAMEAVLNTEAGTQLRELRDGPHAAHPGFVEHCGYGARRRNRYENAIAQIA